MLTETSYIPKRIMNKTFILQWHITNLCDNNCRHCYMTSDERVSDKDLGLDACYSVIDDLVSFTSLVGLTPRITFTGGNALMREDIENILLYAKNKGVISDILGNASSINNNSITIMKNCSVARYQLSFEGLQKNHDYIRGEGNFYKSLRAVERLAEAGIAPVVMSTVTTKNKDEIAPLAELVINHGAVRFDFARLVPIGNGKKIKELCFIPNDYRDFLNQTHESYKRMISSGVPHNFLGTKDPLWVLLLYEKGEVIPPSDGLIYDGCSLAKNGLCLDADGTLYGCRRMPVGIGNITKDNIRNVFINSKEMNEYRQFSKLEKCNECEIISLCRGCRAIAWADSGSFYGRDPQCWK